MARACSFGADAVLSGVGANHGECGPETKRVSGPLNDECLQPVVANAVGFGGLSADAGEASFQPGEGGIKFGGLGLHGRRGAVLPDGGASAVCTFDRIGTDADVSDERSPFCDDQSGSDDIADDAGFLVELDAFAGEDVAFDEAVDDDADAFDAGLAARALADLDFTLGDDFAFEGAEDSSGRVEDHFPLDMGIRANDGGGASGSVGNGFRHGGIPFQGVREGSPRAGFPNGGKDVSESRAGRAPSATRGDKAGNVLRVGAPRVPKATIVVPLRAEDLSDLRRSVHRPSGRATLSFSDEPRTIFESDGAPPGSFDRILFG